ncbi:3'-5' exonuclease [Paenibacillus chitinolyticus]|uniref:3'-5' exonuclease n=1 Tax=Paenibacillus chitinolyticus TaxID=79263 RepID=UPI0036571F8C
MNIQMKEDHYLVRDIWIPDLHSQAFCIFDLEGTGIHTAEDDVIQMAAVRVNQDGEPGVSFSSLVHSHKPIPAFIEQLTGIKNEDIYAATAFGAVYLEFLDFIQNRILVTQAGYEYDLPLLRRQCEENKVPFPGNKVLDIKVMFKAIHPDFERIISTDRLIGYYGIDASAYKRHDALGDCHLIARLFTLILSEYKQMNVHVLQVKEPLIIERFRIEGMHTEPYETEYP